MKQTSFFPVAAAILLSIGIVGIVLPQVQHGYLPGDIDTRMNIWVLEHFHKCLTGHGRSFVDGPSFYPWRATIGLQDANWGNGIVYSIARVLGADQYGAFAWWYVVGHLLNFVAAYVALRLFGLEKLGASAGAFLFTFSIAATARDIHVIVLYRFYVPIGILIWARYLEQPRAIRIGLLFVVCALQIMTQFYIGLFLIYFIAAYAAVSIWADARRSPRTIVEHIRALSPGMPSATQAPMVLGCVAAGVVALALFVIPYWRVTSLYHITRPWSGPQRGLDIEPYMPRIQSYVLADRSLLWSSSARMFGESAHAPDDNGVFSSFNGLKLRWEHQMFLGIVPLCALLYAVLNKEIYYGNRVFRRLIQAVFAISAGTLLIGEYSLYQLICWIPGISAARGIARIIFVTGFPIAFAVGVVVDHLRVKASPRVNYQALAYLLVGGVLIESLLVDFRLSDTAVWEQRIAAIDAQIRKPVQPGNILVVSAGENRDWFSSMNVQEDAIHVAQRYGIHTLNGHGGSVPPGWKIMRTCEDVQDVINAGVRFRRSLGERGFSIDPARLVLVGFGDCKLVPGA